MTTLNIKTLRIQITNQIDKDRMSEQEGHSLKQRRMARVFLRGQKRRRDHKLDHVYYFKSSKGLMPDKASLEAGNRWGLRPWKDPPHGSLDIYAIC